MHKIIFLIVIYTSIHASCGCSRGESILSGATLRQTNIHSSDNLFTLNTVTGFDLEIPPGTPVPFNGPVVLHGTAITKLNPSTFLITKPGHYQATFVCYRLIIDDDGVEYQLNGVSQVVSAEIGNPLVLNQILDVTSVPSTLQVVTTGIGVVLLRGTSATISIVELNTQNTISEK
jgi:hypothetical protein